MVFITEDLIRKRAEHNNCELATLEEVSLHQLDIERIEHLDKWCRDLKILYLQSNLIPRIENVSRLKQLEYLNLALNNIDIIENLEGCEFLSKLDLTLNFVGKLSSIESLSCNIHLKEVYLVGNPCAKYDNYRAFVAAVIPQLVTLDGIKIERSERLTACQNIDRIRKSIAEQERAYAKERELEREEEEEKWSKAENRNNETSESQEPDNGEFDPMNDPMKYTPESRVAVHKYLEEQRKPQIDASKSPQENSEDAPRRLEIEGRRLNINDGKYKFSLKDDPTGKYRVLELEAPKYMDTSLITCDVQPYYIHITLKGKILQLVFHESDAVHPDKSKAERCQTSGNLVVTMKRVNPTFTDEYFKEMELQNEKRAGKESREVGREYLEVDPKARHMPDLKCMTTDSRRRNERLFLDDAPLVRKGVAREDFVDDPDVPPLI
ncbi:Protein tilB-like [Oopsacas minuta]|uniref:Protein tilB-like n=1 Tax=Oopsacas minuta TaxID=111878 RepID=A0AAV7JAY2_9METZ|nr:Protein tilB-like [Oopsacas minuta]